MCTIDEGGALCDKDFWAFVFVLCHKHLAGLSRYGAADHAEGSCEGVSSRIQKGFFKILYLF